MSVSRRGLTPSWLPAEWLRLRPSGFVHAFDSRYPPKKTLCERANLNGTTSDFPLRARRCPDCVAMTGWDQP